MFRRYVPESPRWLVTHCRSEEAEETVKQIEADVVKSTGRDLLPVHDNILIALVILIGGTVPSFAEEELKQTFTCTGSPAIAVPIWQNQQRAACTGLSRPQVQCEWRANKY
jgi:hypothetical protein